MIPTFIFVNFISSRPKIIAPMDQIYEDVLKTKRLESWFELMKQVRKKDITRPMIAKFKSLLSK
tara:strand:+ start:59 stop:250 length:192 start_codon:yes stop_codon:yes gene_type:complete